MKKIATHVHTKGRSGCAITAPADIVREYADKGYDGLVVTNHYMKQIFDEYYADIGSHDEKVEFWLDGYRETKREGEALGLSVYLGMELNLDMYNRRNEFYPKFEFLCYGMDEEFVRENSYIYDMCQEDMFELMNSKGYAVCQAHPFRNRTMLSDIRYLHGVEIFNGNPRQDSHDAVAAALAAEFSLKCVAGDDYHEKGDAGNACVYFPDDIKSGKDIARCILDGSATPKILK